MPWTNLPCAPLAVGLGQVTHLRKLRFARDRSGLRAGRLSPFKPLFQSSKSPRWNSRCCFSEDPTFVLSRAKSFLTSEVKLVNHLTARTHRILTYEVKQFELKIRAATGLEFFPIGLDHRMRDGHRPIEDSKSRRRLRQKSSRFRSRPQP